jgi:RNA polymerase sigma-70 factor (ECF subfamily)
MIHPPTELIQAAQRGDPADVERLLETVWPDAYHLARAIVAQAQAAEDAAQDACVLMFRNIASLRNPDAFSTWFYRIVVREALKHKGLQATDAPLDREPAYCEDRATAIDLWRALATLSEHLRTVIVLHYFENLTSREIGVVLRIPDATVRFRLMTARRRLQPLLQTTETAHTKGEELYAL